MAKSKDEPVEDLSLDALAERVCRDTEKSYGDGVLVSGADVVNTPRQRISISPALDIITSGGILEGSWVGITGNPKTGKTSLALSIAANCQKPEYGSRPVYYLKAEGRLAVEHLKGVRGLDLSPRRFNVVQSKKGRLLTAQDFLRIGSGILKTVPGSVLIIDSASALCDEAEITSDIGDIVIASGNRLVSKFVRTHAQVVPTNGCIVLVITHLLQNIGKPGMSERTAKNMQYQYDYMLRTISKSAWKVGDRQVGLTIKWACNTSPLGPPGMTIESKLRFGVGVDRVYEVIDLGMATGLIKGKGWYTLDFLSRPDNAHLLGGDEVPKVQGSERIYQLLLDRPEWAAALEREVLKMAGALAGSGGDD